MIHNVHSASATFDLGKTTLLLCTSKKIIMLC